MVCETMRLYCQCNALATRYAIVTVGMPYAVLYMCDECSEMEAQYGTEIHRLYLGEDKYGRKQLSEVISRLLRIKPMTIIGLSWRLEKHPCSIERILSRDNAFTVIGKNSDNVEVWGVAAH